LEESSESRPWQIKSQKSGTEALSYSDQEYRDNIFGAKYSDFQNTENFYLVLRQLQDVSQLSKTENGSSSRLLEQVKQVKKALQELERYIADKMRQPK